MTVLPQLDREGANAAHPASINNEGQIVGGTRFGTGPSRATLWQEGAVFDLNELVRDDDPAKPFVTLTFGLRVTDSGLILASGVASREPEPQIPAHFLLTPAGTLPATAPPAVVF